MYHQKEIFEQFRYPNLCIISKRIRYLSHTSSKYWIVTILECVRTLCHKMDCIIPHYSQIVGKVFLFQKIQFSFAIRFDSLLRNLEQLSRFCFVCYSFMCLPFIKTIKQKLSLNLLLLHLMWRCCCYCYGLSLLYNPRKEI